MICVWALSSQRLRCICMYTYITYVYRQASCLCIHILVHCICIGDWKLGHSPCLKLRSRHPEHIMIQYRHLSHESRSTVWLSPMTNSSSAMLRWRSHVSFFLSFKRHVPGRKMWIYGYWTGLYQQLNCALNTFIIHLDTNSGWQMDLLKVLVGECLLAVATTIHHTLLNQHPSFTIVKHH